MLEGLARPMLRWISILGRPLIMMGNTQAKKRALALSSKRSVCGHGWYVAIQF